MSGNRTTIGLRKATKTRLDKGKAYGQCYDGFVCELLGLWEKVHTPETEPGFFKEEFLNPGLNKDLKMSASD